MAQVARRRFDQKDVGGSVAMDHDVPDSIIRLENGLINGHLDVITNGHDESSDDDEEGLKEENDTNRVALGLNFPANIDRIKKKAKRPSKFQPKDLSRTKSESQIIPAPIRALKNSRKSRNGYGRGLPKKGGAGGKGTWGALGSEMVEEEEEDATDRKDPNYDDANPDSKDIKLKLIDFEKATEEVAKKVTTIVLEYFDHGDTDEVLLSLEELKIRQSSRYVVVTTAIEVAMDHKPSHREMASVLLADLYGNCNVEEDYSAGYDYLLKNLNDLILDTPDAPTILGNFIARSIADDCVPPKFLTGYKGKIGCEHAVVALSRAEGLLSMRHGLVRLDNVWGVGGGTRPVKHLIKKMVLLLQEFLSSSDVKEATRCLQDLEVPHFHHELVYEAVNIVLESINERTSKMMCTLLTSLCRSVIITPNQMKEGFFRIFEDMPQICLDVPPAYSILEKFVNLCNEQKILEVDILKKLPTRGRKRFVSEGDGGRVKDHAYF